MQPLKPSQKMASLGGRHNILWFRKQRPYQKPAELACEGGARHYEEAKTPPAQAFAAASLACIITQLAKEHKGFPTAFFG